jgi:hypothetical protein
MTVRRGTLLVAVALSLFAGVVRAGCGTIVTLNPTDHWAWITIYDLGKTIHMDYGYVAPHSARSWTGGASPLPYACGSFYHVRYEVSSWTDPTKEPQPGATKTFDTDIQINPQLTLSDVYAIIKGIATVAGCLDGVQSAVCLAKFGINESASQALFGAIGSDSTGSVVCLHTTDNKNYWIENSAACALKPKPRAPPPDLYKMMPPLQRVGIGSNTKGSNYTFIIQKNGQQLDKATIAKGTFSTDNPAIANFRNPHGNQFWAHGHGKTTAHWELNGVRVSAQIEVP